MLRLEVGGGQVQTLGQESSSSWSSCCAIKIALHARFKEGGGQWGCVGTGERWVPQEVREVNWAGSWSNEIPPRASPGGGEKQLEGLVGLGSTGLSVAPREEERVN